MSFQDQFTFEAQTPLPGLPFATVQTEILARAAQFDLPVITNTDQETQIATDYGNYSFLLRDGVAHVQVGSSRADWLYVLKESLSDTIAELAPEVGAAMTWSDAQEQAGRRPPNFQFITIREVTQIAGGFLRVVADAEDLSQFTPDAIHFRLAMPDADLATPQWPYLSDTGLTVWPKGEALLHRPVYTVRDMDAATGQLVFDIFEHDGGRTTEWARRAQPGSQIGLTGPGGGGIPQTTAIRIYADETGFPAVARILADLPAQARGQVVLEHTHPSSTGYPLPEHPGFSVTHRTADPDQNLGALAITDLGDTPGPDLDQMIWLAAEKAAAQTLRAHLKAAGVDSKKHYVAAYWTRPAAGGQES